MKKLFSFLLALIMLSPMASAPAFAQSSVGFVEAVENSFDLDSYTQKDHLLVKARTDEVDFQLLMNTNSDVTRLGVFQYDQASQIRLQFDGKIKDYFTDETQSVRAVANLEFTLKDKDAYYFRLNNINLSGSDSLSFELDGVREMVAPYLGQWMHIPVETYFDTVARINETQQVNNPGYNFGDPALVHNLAMEVGFTEAMKEIFKEGFVQGFIVNNPNADPQALNDLVDDLFTLKYFNESTIENGPNAGYVKFSYNTSVFYSAVSVIAKYAKDIDLGVELTSDTEMYAELKSMYFDLMNKMIFNGMYHVDDRYDVLDRLSTQLVLKDVDGLDELTVQYNTSVNNINEPMVIKTPRNSTSLESLVEDFADRVTDIPDYNEDYYYDEDFGPSDFEEPVKEPVQAKPLSERDVQNLIKDNPAIGALDAPITVIEFSDFQCPFCKRFEKDTFPMIQKKYIDTGKVRWVVRDMPLSFHEHSFDAAVAAECVHEAAGDEGYFSFRDYLFSNQESLGDQLYNDWVDTRGLLDQFTRCIDEGYQEADVQQDLDDAYDLGVAGTPSFWVNGEWVNGAQPYEAFEALFEELLNKH